MKNIAIITGASSGMGKEFAKQIACLAEARNIDEIWIIARREDRLLEIADKINAEKKSSVVRPIALDISGSCGVAAFKAVLEKEIAVLSTKKMNIGATDNPADKKALAESKDVSQNSQFEISDEKKAINISILVNNAGFGTYGPFEETPIEREMEMTDLNCTSLVGLTGVCLPYMSHGGIIINTASLASFLPLGEFAVYGATKSYVLSFSVALAAELKSRGITVTAMCPGPVSTEFANVASGGARPKVRHGLPADKVVAHCLKKALQGKRIAIYAFKWKFKKAASRFVPRYLGAWFTFKYCKRPSALKTPKQ